MVFAGVFTVIISLVFFGVGSGLVSLFSQAISYESVMFAISMPFLILILGSILSVGIPYFAAAALSQLFVDIDR
ncbi:hypothetical protein GCM10009069_18720 [Algimonas arctica]|uniref:Uncharacterized protein n=1 Tax=Algimonas arctica TaxID=1479486 RepID=A0A8J3G2P9_9PROT|nr:hypothetical protein GCM10009069_18720 [Algimonas arctica]